MDQNNHGTSGDGGSSIEQQAKTDFNEAKSTLQGDLSSVTDKAKEDVQALKSEAQAQVEAVTDQAKAFASEQADKARSFATEQADKARSFASEQKDFAASQLTGVAAAIGKVADELEGDNSTIARYARDLADNLDGFGKQVEGKDVDQLMGMAQQFGRSQPLAFLGAAALAGFVAARFAGASAQRATKPTTPQSGQSTGNGTSYGASSRSTASTGSSSYSSASSAGSAYAQPKSTF